jgi:hypothetical protein
MLAASWKFCCSLGMALCKSDVNLTEPNTRVSCTRVSRFPSLVMVWLDNLLLPYILSYLNRNAIHSCRVHPKHGKYKEPFKCIPVTTNLAPLPRHLRQSIIPRLLWADAICFHVDRYRVKYRRNLRFGPLFPGVGGVRF